MSMGAPLLNEAKDSIVAAWQWATKSSILIEEEMRGFRVNITDCELMSDAIHRGGGQTIPTARRLFIACELSNSPGLLEPVFLCEITCPEQALHAVCEVVKLRKGQIVEETKVPYSVLSKVTASFITGEVLSASCPIIRLGERSPRCFEGVLILS